uniref:SKP1 component dimerisation domain-containing protein n=1 Tax=Ditylenchus dipsaci TaxID=166011 RepID=A0A915EVD9_9BILA
MCDAHIGEPELEIKEDEHTRERIGFRSNYLDIKSLYLYGCQRVAAEIRGKSPEAIREMFELEDDLTDEEKEKIKKDNVW